jgi:hypothetical protein
VRFDHIAHQVPDIAEAVAWQQELIPGTRVIYQDATWALVESGGAKLAFVTPEQHPNHIAYRVDEPTLERIAAQRGEPIALHRDRTRSIYVRGPGALCVEIIAYPSDD